MDLPAGLSPRTGSGRTGNNPDQHSIILPVNSPQGMVGYGTGAFAARDFIRTGIAITVLAYLLTLVFGATYWRWLGYV